MSSNFNKVNTAKSGSTTVKSCLKCRYNNTNFLMTKKSIFLLLFGVIYFGVIRSLKSNMRHADLMAKKA